MKMTVSDLKDLRDKRVLVRVDFNVPRDEAGNVTDDRRIKAALPTIQHIINAGGKAILMSHLGQPEDPAQFAKFKLDRIGERLGQLLGRPVKKTDEVVCPAQTVAAMKPGDVLLLENLRLHPGEKAKDASFAKQLAELADVYVNDAFGTCHRKDASMVAVPKAMAGKPRVVGFLVAKELEVLGQLLSSPKRPVLGILGGAKVADKIKFVEKLVTLVDKVLIGGAMTYTFMKAQERGIGGSRFETEQLDFARKLLAEAHGKILLPVDHLVATKPEPSAPMKVVDGEIPDGWCGLDIGPKTIDVYCGEIAKAGTAVWNGPMGKFEDEPFSKGTRAVAAAMASAHGITVVGGGETAEAVEEFGLAEKMKHVSTGGGAFLAYVEGTPFAALAEIDEK